jgi:hypothetical protein
MGPQAYFGQAFAMATSSNLRLDFSLRGARGVIEAFVTPNHDPVAVGYSLLSGGLPVDFANGFPVCRATVAYQAEGYAAVFGWTQLVRSTEVANAQFEVDPDRDLLRSINPLRMIRTQTDPLRRSVPGDSDRHALASAQFPMCLARRCADTESASNRGIQLGFRYFERRHYGR